MYYQTTTLPDNVLAEYNAKNIGQNDLIMEIFKTSSTALSPSDVFKVYPDPRPPLTSIRRAITTLTYQGYLQKTEDTKTSIYGRPEHIWTLTVSR